MSFLASLANRLPRSWIKFIARLQWRNPLFKRIIDWGSNRLRRQDGVIGKGVGQGLRFNPGLSTPGYLLGTSEPQMQETLKNLVRPGMCIYDVGANVGFFSVLCARLTGKEGKVFSFDPLPSNAAQVRHNVALNQFEHITVRECAIGNVDGKTSFNVSSEVTWGKLATVGNPAEEIGTIEVEILRLDTLQDKFQTPPPDLVKMDVEGAEIDALLGSPETLSKVRPLWLIELHGTNQGVADILSQNGYRIGVLGSPEDVTTARWDVQIIAVPQERTDLVPLFEELTGQVAATPASRAS